MFKKNIKSLNEFHSLLVKHYGEKALSRRSLTTLINKRVALRKNTVSQICVVLECSIDELIKNTDTLLGGWEHVNSSILMHNYAYQFLVSNHPGIGITRPFSVEKLLLRKGATVPIHIFKNEPTDTKISIYVIRGSLEVHHKNVEKGHSLVRAGQCLNILASKNLYISGPTNRNASAIIIAHPGREKYYKDPAEISYITKDRY